LAKSHDSAEKRHRQSEVRRLANKAVKSSLKTGARKFLVAMNDKDATVTDGALKALVKQLDTAARKGVISRNAAARKKSRMQRLYNAQKATPQTAKA
jgi:small subunit ribosomal protein S20